LSSGDEGLAKKGRRYERSQYFLRSADGVVHDPDASVDAQAETTGCPAGIAKDMPVVRIDHATI